MYKYVAIIDFLYKSHNVKKSIIFFHICEIVHIDIVFLPCNTIHIILQLKELNIL